MAETRFIATDQDAVVILESLLNDGCEVLADRREKNPVPHKVSKPEKEIQEIFIQEQFFILNKRFSLDDLKMVKFNKDGEVHYYVGQTSGGPFLTLFYHKEKEENGKRKLGSCYFSYPSSFYIASENRQIKAPNNLKAFYAEFIKKLKLKKKKLDVSSSYRTSMTKRAFECLGSSNVIFPRI